MSKFKVGDLVQLNGLSGFFRVTIVEVEETTMGSSYKSVVAESSVSGYSKGDYYTFGAEEYFSLVQEEDDPLPEVEDSVFYTDHRIIKVERSVGSDEQVFLSLQAINGSVNGIGAHIDADVALQIAHDLTRQAMEAKRRIKAADQEEF